jgi:hypothetical protein
MNILNMLNKILGGGTGGVLISGTAAVNGSFDYIVVNQAAVFEVITVEGANVVAARGLTGASVTAGMYLSAGRLSTQQYAAQNAKITSIKLVSGTVIAY